MSKSTLNTTSEQGNRMPSVSAVTVNFNGGDCIINCIQALYRQEVPLEAIIVVDNGSTDGSPGRIRDTFPDVQLLELGENLGLPAARNIGLQHTTTDTVLLIDDDVYVAEDCLRYLLKRFCENQPTVICPRIILIPEHDIVQCDGAEAHFVGTMLLRHGYQPLKESSAEATDVGGCIGACLFLDREKVMAAGGFDEAYFFYFEDLEFSLRLRALGHRLVCEPVAVVYHDRGAGTPNISFRGEGTYPARRAYLTLRHRLLTMLLHYRVRTLIVLLPALTLYELATLVAILMRGRGREWVGAYLSLLSDISNIWQRRNLIQQKRRVNDKELLVGGPVPLAPGFIRSSIGNAAVTIFSTILNSYWRVAQRWIG